MAMVQPVQLRLSFSSPEVPATLSLSLNGLRVRVEATDPQLAWTYLTEAGAGPSLAEGRGVSFPAANLAALAELPEQVQVRADRTLRTLVDLVLDPSVDERPAELSCAGDRSLWLSWFDGVVEHHDPVPVAAAGVLLTADLPFVATPAAFDALRAATTLPMLLGRAQLNTDGFIEISASKPQLVELAPLPGLFRIEDTRFGMSLAYADALDQAQGFAWVSGKPVLDHGPSVLPQLPMPLSAHAAGDLRRLVEALAAYRSQAVVWGSGLGRRVFSLAAVDVLDAWPILVVCTPATLWAWQRHLEMFGRSASLDHADADAQLVTYENLARLRPHTSPQTIVLDDIGAPGALTARTKSALRRLDAFTDAYRLAISSTWPSDPTSVVDVMSVLRPAEFRPGLPLATRYPGNSAERFAAHVRAYVSTRSVDTPGNDPRPFRRSNVIQVHPTAQQKDAAAAAVRRHAGNAPAALLMEALEIESCGPALSLSPKISAVAARAQAALTAGRRVAILVRHRRTATLLRGLVRNHDTVSVEADATRDSGVPRARLVLVRYDRDIPDLRWFDDVLVVDLPWSWQLLDAAVGSPVNDDGAGVVTVFHTTGGVDDRLALLASRRQQLGPVIDQSAPPSAQDITYLLEALPLS